MLLRNLFRFLPRGAFAEGVCALQAGDFATARERFRASLSEGSGRPRERLEFQLCEACIQHGDELATGGDLAGASDAYREALTLHCEYADVHKKLGDALRRAGALDLAAASLRRALELNPRFYGARLSLARVLSQAGDLTGTAETLGLLLGQCPPLLRQRIAEAVDRCRAGDGSAVAAAFDELEGAQPDELDAKKSQALEAIQRGDNGLAIALLADLIARRGDYADLHYLLGLAYGNAAMLEDAMLEFRRALELNPGLTKARINLGITLMETGRHAEAAEELRHADDEEPYNPLVMNALKELATLVEA
jgi:Flp pilus assembly protein TadD